eukprot:CAMPEP_0196717708 /NCGR_PEP_ID=MMETSP1091-20130531/1073_1 /TAXON_ID=302021 /ORGANISM="Rhodomonas sp., Strain CCMP768" /LENGTH=296 /DNA_ID=CAMNT_0042058159 /DNA_START=14 /DNA_END=904 /DNA_ORIENTATION=-
MVKVTERPLLGGATPERRPVFATIAVMGAVALMATALVAWNVRDSSVELIDVPVSGSTFPSYYTASAAPQGSAQMNVAQGQSLSDCDGGMTVLTTMCGGFMPPAAGVAAAPYMAPPMLAAPAYAAPPAPYAAPYSAAYAAPAGYNSYQAPTVWSGDHVVSAGQPEWAAEDAAQHALNLANWRIKLLQAKLEQAKLAAKVMNVATPSCNTAKCESTPATLRAAPSKTATELRQMKHEMLSLASSTSSAISALAAKVGGKQGPRHDRHRSYLSSLKELKATTDKQLDQVLKKIDAIAH